MLSVGPSEKVTKCLNLKTRPIRLFWCQIRVQHCRLPQKLTFHSRNRQQCHVKKE